MKSKKQMIIEVLGDNKKRKALGIWIGILTIACIIEAVVITLVFPDDPLLGICSGIGTWMGGVVSALMGFVITS